MISSDIGDIERRLRILQNGIEKLGTRVSANARDTADGLGEAVALALSTWADRFRQGSLGEKSAAFGKDAARYGTAALVKSLRKQNNGRSSLSRWLWVSAFFSEWHWAAGLDRELAST